MLARKLSVLLILCALLGLGAGVAHGELGAPRPAAGGIAADVEIAHVLDAIEAGTARQERLSQEAGSLGSRKAQTRKTLRLRIRALYRVTRAGMAPLAGGFEAVRNHVARVRRLSSFIRNDAHALQALEQRAVTIKDDLGALQAELARSRARLATLQEHDSTVPAEGFMQVLAQTGSASAQTPGGGFYGIRFSDEGEPAAQTGFEALRGRLVSPISGEVRVVDARREESDGPGLEFQAPIGTVVRAAAAGRVAFCDRYGSYGRLVILDHGDGYYTAYGGLTGVEVRVGDDLSANARLGSIGSAESGTPSLFFEVRKGTRTLSPRPWLGL